nr:hypothetical protein [uncultured Sellimonas sp.]
MKLIKKRGFLLLGSLMLSAVLLAGCSGQSPETKQLRALCEELFSFPGGSADQVLAAAQDDSSGTDTDTDTEEQSGDLSQTIEDVYGDYFTESGLQNFYRSGFPLKLYYAAQEKDCELSFEKIEKIDGGGEQENTETYSVEIRVNGNTVHQEIDAAFEDGKVDYFYFADDELFTAIDEIS